MSACQCINRIIINGAEISGSIKKNADSQDGAIIEWRRLLDFSEWHRSCIGYMNLKDAARVHQYTNKETAKL